MITIKAIWLYAAIAAAVCGGFGIGAVVYPSNADLERAIHQARVEAIRDCATTSNGKPFTKGEFNNTKGKGF